MRDRRQCRSEEAVADDAGLLDVAWMRIARVRSTLAVDDGEALLTARSGIDAPASGRTSGRANGLCVPNAQIPWRPAPHAGLASASR